MLSYWKICIFFGVFSCIVWETFQDCVFQGSRIDLLSPSLFRISQQFKKRQIALLIRIEVVGKVTVFSAFRGVWGGNCQCRSIFPNILKKGVSEEEAIDLDELEDMFPDDFCGV